MRRDRGWFRAVFGLALAGACSSQGQPTPIAGAPAAGAAGVSVTAGAMSVSQAGATAAASAATGAASGAGGASATAGSGGSAAVSGDLPCAVADFLQLHCVQCHGHMPRLGAPMSLVDAASFQVQRSGQSVYALAAMRVQNMARPMPPSGLLPAADVAGFVQWTTAGAMPQADGCGVKEPAEMGAAGAGTTATGTAGPVAGGGSVSEPGSDWVMFGGDLGDSRNNTGEKVLGASNVAMLQPLWTFKGASTTSTPAVAGGVVYLPTWDGKVHALDEHTGTEMWATSLPDLIDSSPAVSDTQVFVSDDNGAVHALERSTGMLQWSKSIDPHPEAHLWSSPIYVPDANLLVIGVASGEEQVQPPFSFKGSVVGLDAASGEERWRFQTTNGDASSGPGVGVWATPVIDTSRKLAFVGTGNAYSGTAGQYVDSMLAIDYETGKLAWSHQFTMNDVFSIFGGSLGPDFDIGASANLFDVADKAVIGIGIKSGDYAVLDRTSGTVLWTQHITSGSSMGGIIGSPAYADGKVFLASNSYSGGQSSTVAALDAQRGDVLWKKPIEGGLVYGGLVVAGGAVFVGTSGAKLMAFDATSGDMLWSATTPDAIGGGPSVANGMLLVPWGYTWTLREGEAGSGGLTAYGLK